MSLYPQYDQRPPDNAPVPDDWGEPVPEADARPRAEEPENAYMPPFADDIGEWGSYPEQPLHRRSDRHRRKKEERTVYRASFSDAREHRETDGVKKRSGERRLWAPVCVVLSAVSIAVIALILNGYLDALACERAAETRYAVLYSGRLPENVFIDDVYVGGLTPDEAAARLSGQTETGRTGLDLRVCSDSGAVYRVTEEQIPFSRNTGVVITQAAAFSWQGMRGTEDASISPAEYRLRNLDALKNDPVGARYYTRVTWSNEDVLRTVSQIAGAEDRPVKDSEAVFDIASRTFSYSEEQEGIKLNATGLYESLVSLLDGGVFRGEVRAETEITQPRVYLAQLMNSFGLISTYTTQTTDDRDRNTNVRLACEAVNGTAVLPFQLFSFNAATGQRTEQKGYRPAAAIAGGTTVDEIGGGVCQVSSTLFNAAAMAGLEIRERSPHTWPSGYVDKGRDATVNWPNLDFTFVNDRDTPVYIIAEYHNRTCTVNLYGKLLPPGESILLETEVIREEAPPEEPVYVYNEELPAGTERQKKKARTGYTVNTWRVYTGGGAEINRELLCVSDYKMIQETIEYH